MKPSYLIWSGWLQPARQGGRQDSVREITPRYHFLEFHLRSTIKYKLKSVPGNF